MKVGDMVRHCTFTNGANPTDHGTESPPHGIRALEVYQNWFQGSQFFAEHRSGTLIDHDNIFQGYSQGYKLLNHRNVVRKNNGSARGDNRAWFRVSGAYGPTVDQNTPLSPNPTGTPSAGNEPSNGNVSPDEEKGVAQVMNSATCNSTNTCSAQFTAQTKSLDWTTPGTTVATDRWRTIDPGSNWSNNAGYAYQLVNTDQPTLATAYIVGLHSGTTNSLDIEFIDGPQNDPPIWFASGEHYAIRKVYAAQDQPGHGVIDVVSSSSNIANTNTTTGTVSTPNVNYTGTGTEPIGWLNQQLDPYYSWNNWTGGPGSFAAGTQIDNFPAIGSLKEGRDFFNRTVKPATGTFYAPGYPVASTQTAAAKRVGAFGVTGQSGTTYSQSISTVYGLDYPHPLVSSCTSVGFDNGLTGTSAVKQGSVTNNGDKYIATSFTATSSGTTCKIVLALAKVGSPTYNLYVELRADDGTGQPSSTVLATSNPILAASLNTTSTNITFDGISSAVTANAILHPVLRSDSGAVPNGSDYVQWFYTPVSGNPVYKSAAGLKWNVGITNGSLGFSFIINKARPSFRLW